MFYNLPTDFTIICVPVYQKENCFAGQFDSFPGLHLVFSRYLSCVIFSVNDTTTTTTTNHWTNKVLCQKLDNLQNEIRAIIDCKMTSSVDI